MLSYSCVCEGMYIAGVFKNMGEDHFKDEVFLTAVGTYAALSNTLARLIIGVVADRYGPLRTLWGINIIFCVVMVTYAYTPYVGQVG
jgi:nitrate/nitrite transporter NarK